MKVVQINSTCNKGSTGKITVAISELLKENDVPNYILYCFSKENYKLGIKYSNEKYIKIQALYSKIKGNYGFNSKRSTQKLLNILDHIHPEIIHLHNIHSHDCNIQMLFEYIKKNNIKIFWTFHDCWAFTGYCTYFTFNNCNKWKTKCYNCVQRKKYSLFFDKSSLLFDKKKELLNNLDLTIITPSKWLANLVKESFLKCYPVLVINNGIDLQIFKYYKSDLRKQYNLENKYVILGVSFEWEKRKGLDVFIELSKRLDERFQIVLVGTDNIIDKTLPSNIISIHRTYNQKELAKIYSMANVFVNPTREENYPTVNMEALACGTPVITFDTGGSSEMLDDTCGSVVECDDIDSLEGEIIDVCINKKYLKQSCLKKAKDFDMQERFKDYINLYLEDNL